MFELTITTDNASFEPDAGRAVAALLAAVAGKLAGGERAGRILDANGNSVGEFSFAANLTPDPLREALTDLREELADVDHWNGCESPDEHRAILADRAADVLGA